MLSAGAAVLLLAAGGAFAAWHSHLLGPHRSRDSPAVAARLSSPAAVPTAASEPQSPSPSASTSPPDSSLPPSPPAVTGPAGVVVAYFAAINAHRYARAWHLGGYLTEPSLSVFASGFGTTADDAVTIESVSGDNVSARLVATQTDGTVKVYSGSYTVSGGVIVHFDVQQVS